MQRQQTGGRLKASLFLAGALGVAALTSYLVWQVLVRANQEVARAKAGPEVDTIVVASRDLYMGIPIAEDDLTTISTLPGTVPTDLAFATIEEVVGRTPRERVLAQEVVRAERLARRDAGVGLNAIISPGKRAMTIETDTQSSLSGFLQPGNYVDIIVTIRPDDRNASAKWVTETILQGILVLAVGDATTGASNEAAGGEGKKGGKKSTKRRKKPTITLELTPGESEKLALANSKGDLHMVLRSDVDITQQETGGPLNTNTMLGFEPEDAPAPVAKASKGRGGRGTRPAATPVVDPNTVTAEVIEGSTTTSVEFDEDGNRQDSSDNNRRRGR